MSKLPLQIIFEDYYLLVINKPAGMVVEYDSWHPSVEQSVREYFKSQHPSRKEPFVGIVHRLDRPVSGVLLIAKTKQALVECGKQFENRTTEKKYIAKVEGSPVQPQGILKHWLLKDYKLKRSFVFDQPGKNRQESILEYKVMSNEKNNHLLEIKLHTGRFHQIRAQFAFIGCPIVGDVKYGSKVILGDNKIALHAVSLQMLHPKTGEEMEWKVPLPVYF